MKGRLPGTREALGCPRQYSVERRVSPPILSGKMSDMPLLLWLSLLSLERMAVEASVKNPFCPQCAPPIDRMGRAQDPSSTQRSVLPDVIFTSVPEQISACNRFSQALPLDLFRDGER